MGKRAALGTNKHQEHGEEYPTARKAWKLRSGLCGHCSFQRMNCHPAGTTENLRINRLFLMEKAKTFPLCCRSDWPSFQFSIQLRAGWDFLLDADEILSIVTGIEDITENCTKVQLSKSRQLVFNSV